MFFCPNCNNSFDIAKTAPSKDKAKKEKKQTGGKSIDELIDKILAKEGVTQDDVKGVTVDNLTKNPRYKKLKSKDKEHVFNTIQDLLPKAAKVVSKTETTQLGSIRAYFVCDNCGFTKKIEPRTKIFSRSSDDISQTFGTTNYDPMLYSKIHPITRFYVCPNSKCESHKDPKKREAMFFRLNNSYKVKYICKTCKTAF